MNITPLPFLSGNFGPGGFVLEELYGTFRTFLYISCVVFFVFCLFKNKLSMIFHTIKSFVQGEIKKKERKKNKQKTTTTIKHKTIKLT